MIDLNEKPLCTIPRVMCWAVDNLELLKSQPGKSVDHIIPLSIDPEQHNKIENLQWVHSDINRMKNNHSEEDFLKYIKLIYENRLCR